MVDKLTASTRISKPLRLEVKKFLALECSGFDSEREFIDFAVRLGLKKAKKNMPKQTRLLQEIGEKTEGRGMAQGSVANTNTTDQGGTHESSLKI